jgi:hypothetical protein
VDFSHYEEKATVEASMKGGAIIGGKNKEYLVFDDLMGSPFFRDDGCFEIRKSEIGLQMNVYPFQFCLLFRMKPNMNC